MADFRGSINCASRPQQICCAKRSSVRIAANESYRAENSKNVKFSLAHPVDYAGGQLFPPTIRTSAQESRSPLYSTANTASMNRNLHFL